MISCEWPGFDNNSPCTNIFKYSKDLYQMFAPEGGFPKNICKACALQIYLYGWSFVEGEEERLRADTGRSTSDDRPIETPPSLLPEPLNGDLGDLLTFTSSFDRRGSFDEMLDILEDFQTILNNAAPPSHSTPPQSKEQYDLFEALSQVIWTDRQHPIDARAALKSIRKYKTK